MFQSTKSRLLALGRIKRLRIGLIYAAANLLIFGSGAFSHETSAQTPVPLTANQRSDTKTANQAKAEKLMEEAAALEKENTNAFKRRAIVKYKQAAALLRNDKKKRSLIKEKRSFIALNNTAKLYKELSEPDRAIDYW